MSPIETIREHLFNFGLKLEDMKNQNELQDIRKQIGQYFDQQLDETAQQEFLDRVHADPAFHRVFTREKAIRDNLKKHAKRPGPSPDLIQAIKNNIRII